MTDETVKELKLWIEYAKLMAALENERTPTNVGDEIRKEATSETFLRMARAMSTKIKNVKRRQRRLSTTK